MGVEHGDPPHGDRTSRRGGRRVAIAAAIVALSVGAGWAWRWATSPVSEVMLPREYVTLPRAQVRRALELVGGRWLLRNRLVMYQGETLDGPGIVGFYRASPRLLREQDGAEEDRIADVWFLDRGLRVRRTNAETSPGRSRSECRAIWERALVLEAVFAYAQAHGHSSVEIAIARTEKGWTANVRNRWNDPPWAAVVRLGAGFTVVSASRQAW